MLRDAKLSTKLMAGFAIVALIVAIVGGFGWYGVSRMTGEVRLLITQTVPSVESILTIQEAVTAIKCYERTLLLPNLTQSRADRQLVQINESMGRAEEAIQIYNQLERSQEEDGYWSRFTSLWTQWRQDHTQFMNLYQQYSESPSQALLLSLVDFNLGKESDSLNPALAEIEKLVADNEIKLHEQEQSATALSRVVSIVVAVTGAAGIILAVILGWSLGRAITRRILVIVDSLGDASVQVAAASEQLSSAGQQVTTGVNELASSVEETSSTLEELASMVQQNAENTRQADSLAGRAQDTADKGSREMQEMMSAMSEIKRSSDQIAKIIKVVDEIAFQTNILALNAAVEAARVGDVGMGFAVVAEEVRNLAQRSAQAAKDTANIIESNIELSERGAEVSKRAAESLAEITLQTKKVNELMNEIAAASQEQSQGINQISMAVSQMEVATQQNAAGSEEAASAAEELASQAESMQEMVNDLVLLVKGVNSEETEGRMVKPPVNSRRPAVRSSGGGTALGKAAVNRQPTKGKARKPEEIIPLEDDTQGF